MVTATRIIGNGGPGAPEITTDNIASPGRYQGYGPPTGRIPARIGADYLDLLNGKTWRKTSNDLLDSGWEIEDDSDDSDVFITATGSETPRLSADRWADVKNVLDFGPESLAGHYHSYIQLAIDACGEDGGTVYIPSGRYLIGAPIRVRDGIRLIGDGESTELFLVAGANCSIITNEAWDKSNSNIYIAFMHLDGNRTNQSSAVGDGPGQSLIDLINVKQSVVEKVTGTSAYLHGIDCGVRDEVDNSIKTILTTGGSGTPAVGQTLTGGTSGATGTISVVGSDFLAVDTITGTFQSGETLTASVSGATRVAASTATTQLCDDVRINNCHFRDFGDDGVTTHHSTRISVIQCSFQDSAATYSNSSNGIEFDDGSYKCSADSCFSRNCSSGFMVQGHAGRIPARRITFVNCDSVDNDNSFHFAQPTTAHASIPALDVTVLGGNSENDSRAFLIDNYAGITITGRTVKNATTSFMTLSSLVAGLTKNIQIIGGTIRGSPIILTGANTKAVKFVGVEITEFTGSAVITCGIPYVTFDACNIHDITGQGIKISSGGVGTVITGGTAINNCTAEGIELGADSCIILGNEIHDNSVGIRVLAGSYNAIRNNRITANTTYGIRFSNSAGGGECRGNDVNGNTTVGILVDATKGVGWTITQNPGSLVDTGSAQTTMDLDTLTVDDLTAYNPMNGVLSNGLIRPLNGLYFDGSAGTKTTTAIPAIGLVGTIIFRFRCPSANPSGNVGLYSSTSNATAHVSDVGDVTLYFDAAGTIAFRLHNATGSRIAYITNFVTTYAGQPVAIAIVKTAAGVLSFYINWKLATHVESTTDTSPPADWAASFAGVYFHTGIRSSAERFAGVIFEDAIYNRALSTQDLENFAQWWVDYSDRSGSQTVLNSGTLTLGKRYRIVSRTDGDFVAAGAANNTIGTEFVALTTSVGLLDAGDTAVQIGAIIHHRYDLVGTVTVPDNSSNALHATAAGGVLRIGGIDPYNVSLGNALQFQIDNSATATHTKMLVKDVDSGLVQRVKTGANGTGPGGVGRALYVDNV